MNMAFHHSCASIILAAGLILITLDNASAKPTLLRRSLHNNLRDPCGVKNNGLGMHGEVDEKKVWGNMRFLGHEIRNAVKQIMNHQDQQSCKDAPSIPLPTLSKLSDFTQIKDIREASKAAYSDIMNAVAHFNILSKNVDSQKCWQESLHEEIDKLRSKMLPYLCSLNLILEADAHVLLEEVIALKIIAHNQECSYHSTVTCTLLEHVQDLANALNKYDVPS